MGILAAILLTSALLLRLERETVFTADSRFSNADIDSATLFDPLPFDLQVLAGLAVKTKNGFSKEDDGLGSLRPESIAADSLRPDSGTTANLRPNNPLNGHYLPCSDLLVRESVIGFSSFLGHVLYLLFLISDVWNLWWPCPCSCTCICLFFYNSPWSSLKAPKLIRSFILLMCHLSHWTAMRHYHCYRTRHSCSSIRCFLSASSLRDQTLPALS